MRQHASMIARRRGITLGLGVIAVILLAALTSLATIALHRVTTETTAIPVLSVGEPHIVTEQQLRAFGAENGPIYWAGPREDVQYELTYTTSGSVYVRYLPAGTAHGHADGAYLTVANYMVADSFEHLVEQGNIDGFTSALSQNGAEIVTEDSDRTRVYFAFQDLPLQVEVFDPEEGQALELVSNGSVVLLQEGKT